MDIKGESSLPQPVREFTEKYFPDGTFEAVIEHIPDGEFPAGYTFWLENGKVEHIRMQRMTDRDGTLLTEILFCKCLCLHQRYHYRFTFGIDSHIHSLADLNCITGTLQTNEGDLCIRIVPVQIFRHFRR